MQGADNIGQVSEFLRAADGAVKIEDVLPLFPDFARIDAFKGALCEGLADYNAQIQALKAEMEDATRIADALRCDLDFHSSIPDFRSFEADAGISSIKVRAGLTHCRDPGAESRNRGCH